MRSSSRPARVGTGHCSLVYVGGLVSRPCRARAARGGAPGPRRGTISRRVGAPTRGITL